MLPPLRVFAVFVIEAVIQICIRQTDSYTDAASLISEVTIAFLKDSFSTAIFGKWYIESQFRKRMPAVRNALILGITGLGQ